MQYGVPPLQSQDQTLATSLNAQIRRPIEEDSGPEVYDSRYPPDSRYGLASPSRDTFFNRRGLDSRDSDERPGEVEIMRDIFSAM